MQKPPADKHPNKNSVKNPEKNSADANAPVSAADAVKKKIGEYAVHTFVKSGMAIGLGTGSTAVWAVREIARLYQAGLLADIRCAVTGPGTALEAARCALPVYDLNSPRVQTLDVTIDGADEFDDARNLIKGGGGCLFHEKIVAYSSALFVCVADEKKRAAHAGDVFPVPVEVAPVAVSRVTKKLYDLFDVQSLILRPDARGVGPWITVEGNYILDVKFARGFDPSVRETELKKIVGVIESGIFSASNFAAPPTLCLAAEDGSVRVVPA